MILNKLLIYSGLDPAPVGSYPEELLAVAPGGLPSWDDVRVRYDYYKKRGYLRGNYILYYRTNIFTQYKNLATNDAHKQEVELETR